MIEPYSKCKVLSDYPPITVPLAVRLCTIVLRKTLLSWRKKCIAESASLLEELVSVVGQVQSRRVLHQLLGKPVYALSGEQFKVEKNDKVILVPDRLERYHRFGCDVDLWFKDNRVVQVVSFVSTSVWDLALGILP